MSQSPVDFSFYLNAIGVIVAISALTVALIAVYFGYLTYSIKKHVQKDLEVKIEGASKRIFDMLNIKLKIIEVALADFFESYAPRGDDDTKAQIYLIQHLIRLSSNEPDEVKKALLAFHGKGPKSCYKFIPYIERIKAISNWDEESVKYYNEFINRKV